MIRLLRMKEGLHIAPAEKQSHRQDGERRNDEENFAGEASLDPGCENPSLLRGQDAFFMPDFLHCGWRDSLLGKAASYGQGIVAQGIERQRNPFGIPADQGQGLIRKDLRRAASRNLQPVIDVLPRFFFS